MVHEDGATVDATPGANVTSDGWLTLAEASAA
jgi:hypothetical protein